MIASKIVTGILVIIDIILFVMTISTVPQAYNKGKKLIALIIAIIIVTIIATNINSIMGVS